jgi:hypothetical protein
MMAEGVGIILFGELEPDRSPRVLDWLETAQTTFRLGRRQVLLEPPWARLTDWRLENPLRFRFDLMKRT